jgi:hypothetical protein
MKKFYFLLLFCSVSLFSFSQVFITEIADPDNNAEARYIELYNAGATAVDFTEGSGWQIDKYLNGNPGINATLDLTGSIPAGGFYIVAYNNTDGTFASVYGFSPDQLDNVNNGVAGSNGDDDLALVNGSDVIVDFWGVYDFGTDTNTDNSGTCAEYEDGRAERLTSVTTGSATFNESEWNVWADSAVTGCTSHQNAPRTAPSDFDPGAWGTATCELSLVNASAVCDAVTAGTDTYTATVDFSGGGTSTYTVTADSGTVDLSAGDPSTDATGTITVTGVSEGTDVVISVVDGALCDLSSTVTAASCVPLLTLPITENFDYPDGSLVGNSAWASHGGTAGDFQVLNGQAVVQHGVPSEDVNLPFTSVTGDIYFAFDMVVPDLGVPIGDGGTDFEYFAHFKDSDFGFVAQVDIVAPSATGDYTVGISSDQNVADATWGTDLLYDTTYRITVRYNQDTNIAELWVDASSETDTSILGADEPDPGATIASFAFRQSDSSENEAILVDNLVISQTFDETVLSTSNFDATKFSLYPNPTNTGFVNITSTTADAMNVQVFDILGKQVKNETLVNNRLNVSNLKSGLYMVKITQNNATSTKKLVIN